MPMKKILLLLLFSFSVIAYAAPPPLVTDVIASEIQYVVEDEVQTIKAAAQEVAFCYLGDYELATYQVLTIEQEAKLEFPELVMNNNYYAQVDELNRPPSTTDLMVLEIDKQHSNYGYPLTAN